MFGFCSIKTMGRVYGMAYDGHFPSQKNLVAQQKATRTNISATGKAEAVETRLGAPPL